MTQPKLTPLQEAIKALESLISMRPTLNDYEHGKEHGYEKAIFILEDILPKEQQLLSDTWDAGSEYGFEQGIIHSAGLLTNNLSTDKETYLSQFKPQQ
jgi:hypothetical protein